jgi:hypothetical protein
MCFLISNDAPLEPKGPICLGTTDPSPLFFYSQSQGEDAIYYDNIKNNEPSGTRLYFYKGDV